ncbi:hypothetical protein [Pseudonocardia sp. N23]|uniref:hypothetical protein n=1 Tax=Pseudonocardia sp. N23 TaxID=1987376 RepID=UPI000BFB738E|nr:hypothetical protein [Pseudonocardia sp. N23]GAY11256.1 hypothetical protein TOK_5763 [Pseudonocardia sp. N23]
MVLSLLVLALVLVVVAVSVRAHRNGRRPFRLSQFRPSAPFTGLLTRDDVSHADRDVQRLFADLRAQQDAPADLHKLLR